MKRHRFAVPCAILLYLSLPHAAQREGDTAVLQKIRAEGTERSEVMTMFDQLVTVIGPRLTGSPEFKAAADWAQAKFAAWGLARPALESWEFGRGWKLDRLVVEIVEPRYMPLIAYAEAWSASTPGELVGAPVYIGGRTAADVDAMKGKLTGAIVLSQPIVTAFVREDRVQPATSDTPVRIGAPPMPRQGTLNLADARQIAQTVREARPGAILRSSAGEHGTVFVLGRDQGENAAPTIVLAAEHYNMIARMLEKNVPVKLRVHVQTRFLTTDTKGYNVVAELPGTDPALKNEVVLIGAHLDSWHTGTGATDNADGSAAAMEAMRILKAIGARPRRTLRVALWGGEEQGLLGARAYVNAHYAGDSNKEVRDRVAVYLNIDPGMGPIYGWYSEGSAAAKGIFDSWGAPLRDLGVLKNIEAGIGSTDHVAFRDAGIPGFNPVQDYVTYDVRTHHTNVDTYERVREQDLKQNAIVLAWIAYNAAVTDQKFPRPEPRAPRQP
jgi:carboxypeptidase Q